jgi:hypothetical protein
MTNKEMDNKLNIAINKIYSDDGDKYLLSCRACERCLMFRLAYYLQLEFPDYFVDCEFNKMGNGDYRSECKIEPVTDNGKLKGKKMYADIIIHKRGASSENKFCIELKVNRRNIAADFVRLKNMTNLDGFIIDFTRYTYAYQLGASVYLPKDKKNFEIKYFSNGTEKYINMSATNQNNEIMEDYSSL